MFLFNRKAEITHYCLLIDLTLRMVPANKPSHFSLLLMEFLYPSILKRKKKHQTTSYIVVSAFIHYVI